MANEVCCCVVRTVSPYSSCQLVKAREGICFLNTLRFALFGKVKVMCVSNATTNSKSDISTSKMEVRKKLTGNEWFFLSLIGRLH
jgi:hypothetical protein